MFTIDTGRLMGDPIDFPPSISPLNVSLQDLTPVCGFDPGLQFGLTPVWFRFAVSRPDPGWRFRQQSEYGSRTLSCTACARIDLAPWNLARAACYSCA